MCDKYQIHVQACSLRASFTRKKLGQTASAAPAQIFAKNVYMYITYATDFCERFV